MQKILIILFLFINFTYAQKYEFDLKAKSLHLQDDVLYIKTSKNNYQQIIFKAGKITTSKFSPQQTIFKPKQILRDGLVTTGNKNIKHTWLYKQTLDYDHEILGDNIEARAIKVQLQDDSELDFVVDDNHVFEDRKVRLYDINKDNLDEMFVIQTHLSKGASLAMYEVTKEGIKQTASTGYLNRNYRWLNVIGFSDFDGNGKQNVALIKTPHIGGYLTIYEYENHTFKEIYKRYGFTNHYIGSLELDMSAVADLNDDGSDEMILVNMKGKKVKIINFQNRKYKELKSIHNTSKINSAIFVKDLDNDGFKEIIYSLKNKNLIIYTYNYEKKES